jgi:cysteinyl-tRNA synthetase
MENQLKITNSLTREKETFLPITDGFIGMYVCGPTVYSDVHLGNCRTFVSFDIMYRYLLHLGYKVRYVRNVTDVGHLVGDVDTDAEDKIGKKARLEKIEPMEIVQRYTVGFHDMMRLFNTLSPNIEPRATGHIIEQIEMVQQIIDNGLAYEKNGSVYFDTLKFHEQTGEYGKLSGKVLDELMAESRELKKQNEKRNSSDFAIWIKADETHLMRWNSPWSVGFPGWHLECSAMSTKYLGTHFDIHGGGNDLKFPHHENEIAQNFGACNCSPANYWIHTNMLLLNGKKMSKSDGNNITPVELITGNSPHVTKGYSPMSVRFFMIQAHYGSTLDLNDEGLQAAEKGFKRLMEGFKTLQALESTANENGALGNNIHQILDATFVEMNDDFNTPKALAKLFEVVTIINSLKDGLLPMDEVSGATIQRMKDVFQSIIVDIFGLYDETATNNGSDKMSGLMDLVLNIRQQSRENKDWGTSDLIRDKLNELKITVKDGKEGTSWSS